MTEKEKMLAGEYYDPGDEELTQMRNNARKLMKKLNDTSYEDPIGRKKIIKELFAKTGNNIKIENGFCCDYGSNIYVGENFFANYNCVILDVAEVHIGKNCSIAPGAHIYTSMHPTILTDRKKGLVLGKPVTIGDDCWIGGNSVINPGVTLGNNVIVASGAVVTKNFGDNVLLGGVPAKVIKTLE